MKGSAQLAGLAVVLALLAAPARAGDVGYSAVFPAGKALSFKAMAAPGAVA